MKKGLNLFLLLLATGILVLTGCGDKNTDTSMGDQNTQNTQDAQNTQQETEDGEELLEVLPNQNLLTGLNTLTDDAIGKRPVAIMINNIPQAMPQYGIGEADVVFEIPVEGGASRMMALYGDYTQIPEVCSIRSCRKYFPELSEGFDAIYVCSGMNEDVKSYVKKLGIDIFDGTYNTGDLFYRDQNRLNAGYSLEHTMAFSGTGLAAALEKKAIRTDIEEDKRDTAFNFCDINSTVIPAGDECEVATIKYGAMSATLRYDAGSNIYLKEINSNAQLDGVTNEQLAFTNVIILETVVGNDANGANKTIDWTGGDDSVGYYISNGHIQQIHYSKDSVESRLVFYDESGNELEINRGKTYITFCSSGKASFE